MNYPLYMMLFASYLIGSLSFAIIIAKIMRMDDPRSYGSGNAGATNVMRSGNKKAAALTLLGDLLKGLLVIIIARLMTQSQQYSDSIIGLCGVFVIIGHILPIFFKFKGGKGVATAIGVMLGFNFWLFIGLALSWFLVFKLTKISSLSAIIAAALSPVFAYLCANGGYWSINMGNGAYFGATLMIAVIIVLKHKENIIRLIKQEESSFKSSN